MNQELFDHYKHCCEIDTSCQDISEHLPTLMGLASQCEHVTEFGFRMGASFSALMMGQPKHLVTYDLGFDDKVMDKFLGISGTTELQFNKCSTLECLIVYTDLLFIDTLHTYNQLRKELEIHGNRSRKYIAFHDTYTYGLKGEDGSTPGLLQAIIEFMAKNPHWVFEKSYTNNNGLLILRRN